MGGRIEKREVEWQRKNRLNEWLSISEGELMEGGMNEKRMNKR